LAKNAPDAFWLTREKLLRNLAKVAAERKALATTKQALGERLNRHFHFVIAFGRGMGRAKQRTAEALGAASGDSVVARGRLPASLPSSERRRSRVRETGGSVPHVSNKRLMAIGR
jgi:hypothetical protein